jgi:hypothetical protein
LTVFVIYDESIVFDSPLITLSLWSIQPLIAASEIKFF